MLAALKAVFGVKEWPEFTREEVAKHNTPDSVWIVAGEKVFDATEFVRLHPAGPAAILKRAGGCVDCSRDYKFHSQGAREQWKRCQIGVLSAAALQAPIPKNAAPDADMVKNPEQWLHKPLHTMSMSRSASPILTPAPPVVPLDGDDEGGEDPVARGHCCQGGAPSEACKNCPHAPRCARLGRCNSMCRRRPPDALANSADSQIGANQF
jgi:hypothetical protein